MTLAFCQLFFGQVEIFRMAVTMSGRGHFGPQELPPNRHPLYGEHCKESLKSL